MGDYQMRDVELKPEGGWLMDECKCTCSCQDKDDHGKILRGLNTQTEIALVRLVQRMHVHAFLLDLKRKNHYLHVYEREHVLHTGEVSYNVHVLTMYMCREEEWMQDWVGVSFLKGSKPLFYSHHVG